MAGRWKFPTVILAVVALLTALSAKATTSQLPPEQASRETGEPIMAIVSIKSQQVTLYDAEGWILRAPVSTGTEGRETPAGIFAIVEKNKHHRSNMYDDANMPNMQRITWNGIALHGGPLPGYAASHGCVRLPFDFAENLFDKTRIGMRVIISPDDTNPVNFSHHALFSPNAEYVAAAPARVGILAREAEEAAKAFKQAEKAAKSKARRIALKQQSLRDLEQRKQRAHANLNYAVQALPAADQAKVRAEAQQQKATIEAADLAVQFNTAKSDLEKKVAVATAAADKAKETGLKNDEAQIAAEAAQLEVKLLKTSLRNLEWRKNQADNNQKRADKTPSAEDTAKVQTEETKLITQIEKAKSDLKEKIAFAAGAVTAAKKSGLVHEKARRAMQAQANEAALMQQAYRRLQGRKQRADANLRRANMALAAANRAKVQTEDQKRKATVRIAELTRLIELSQSTLKSWIAAAAIAGEFLKESRIRKAKTAQAAQDAKLALEPVSVYISRATQRLYVRRKTDKTAPDEGGRGTVFDSSIEVPVAIRNPDKPIGTHIFTAMEHNDSGLRWSAVTIDNAEDARIALDRINIPQEVLDRIAPTALPRSSVIISDEPLSKETNYRTEFVAVLSNQPQGGFITRKRSRTRVAEKLSDNAVIPNRQKPARRKVPSSWQAPGFLDH